MDSKTTELAIGGWLDGVSPPTQAFARDPSTLLKPDSTMVAAWMQKRELKLSTKGIAK
jgi:hypothetical protein